ncbi:MAG: hypothetical protein NWS01_00035, partial [Burkholderiales bacterium]|nr:hypothetical protein [Burkholderiales bacterium]
GSKRLISSSLLGVSSLTGRQQLDTGIVELSLKLRVGRHVCVLGWLLCTQFVFRSGFCAT